jgi:TRAP-type uncharacterized transport system substrate-binding protein
MKYVNTISLDDEALKRWRTRRKQLVLASEPQNDFIANLLASLLLSRARILDVKVKYMDVPERMCRFLFKNKVDMALIPAPVVKRGWDGTLLGSEKEKMRNLQFIANIQHHFIFCVSSIQAGVQNIHQLRNKRVGIPLRMLTVWMDLESSIFPDGHNIKFTYDDEGHLFQKLKDGHLDAFFYAGPYPSEFLSGIVYDSIQHKYSFIPVITENVVPFLAKHKQYRASVVSLTHEYLPSRYLPTGRGRIWQNVYQANFTTLGYDLCLVCTDKMDNFTGYETAVTIFSGRKLLDRIGQTGRDHETQFIKHHNMSPADIAAATLPDLPVQPGAKEYWISKGMITYCKEPGCMNVIGVKRCQLCDPGVLRTDLQWKSKLRAEKELHSPGCAVGYRDIVTEDT